MVDIPEVIDNEKMYSENSDEFTESCKAEYDDDLISPIW